MSYARFSEGDVYVFLSVGGHLECCGCILNPRTVTLDTTQKMLEHLEGHRHAGHLIPERTVPQLIA